MLPKTPAKPVADVAYLRADPDVVEIVEKLLDLAKHGKTRSVALMWVSDTGDPCIAWTCDAPKDTHAFSAGIADLFFRCYTRRHEQATDVNGDDEPSA